MLRIVWMLLMEQVRSGGHLYLGIKHQSHDVPRGYRPGAPEPPPARLFSGMFPSTLSKNIKYIKAGNINFTQFTSLLPPNSVISVRI